MRRVVLLAAIILCAGALTVGAQTTVRGRVVSDGTGDPIPNARVSVTPTTAKPALTDIHVVLADGDGRFELPAPRGTFRVRASKTGYAASTVTPTGSEPTEFRLKRAAAISGRVTDASGEPLSNASVFAETIDANGHTTAATRTLTNDLGEYRLSGLGAGTYVVSIRSLARQMAVDTGGGVTGFPPREIVTFYPQVHDTANAEHLELQTGDDRSDIDIIAPTNAPVPPMMRGAISQIPAPENPKDAAVIRGSVVTPDGRGIPHAQLVLRSIAQPGAASGVAQTGQITTTLNGVTVSGPGMNASESDESGRFEFRDLVAGRYSLLAMKSGYSQLSTDGSVETVLRGQMLDLAAGETRDRVVALLGRWGTLTGRVFDELGDPIEGATVQLLQVHYEGGRRRLVPAGADSRLTDDLGRYRLFNIQPGQYVVSAAVGDVGSSDLPGYARVYYPGTPTAGEAQFVGIGLSEDMTGIDFAMSRVKTARISGTTRNAAGEGTIGGSLTLLASANATMVTSVPVGARIEADGAFEFANVPPGQYVIQADRGRKNNSTEGEFGALPVSVNGEDVTGLVLQSSLGSSIAGRFTFDSTDPSKRPPRAGVELTPVPVDFDRSTHSPASADVHDDWTFSMTGINGLRRLAVVRLPLGWALKEIRVNDIDVTDRPLPFGAANQSLDDVEVVLTDRVSQVYGMVVDENGTAVPGVSVVAFSIDRDQWYPQSRFLRATLATATGTFGFPGLPAGSYYAGAFRRSAASGDEWQDPDFLNALLPRVTSVTLGDGEQRSVTLTLATR
jgi:protocatechuate 3,4-dioxygenase beta subunit